MEFCILRDWPCNTGTCTFLGHCITCRQRHSIVTNTSTLLITQELHGKENTNIDEPTSPTKQVSTYPNLVELKISPRAASSQSLRSRDFPLAAKRKPRKTLRASLLFSNVVAVYTPVLQCEHSVQADSRYPEFRSWNYPPMFCINKFKLCMRQADLCEKESHHAVNQSKSKNNGKDSPLKCHANPKPSKTPSSSFS